MSNEKVDAQSNHSDEPVVDVANNQEPSQLPKFEPLDEEAIKGLTVAQKLLMVAIIISVALVTIAGTGYWSLVSASNGFEVMTKEIMPEVRVISQLEQGGLSLLNETREYSIERKEETLAQIAEAEDTLNTSLAEYEIFPSSEDTSAENLTEKLREAVREVQSQSGETTALLEAGISDEERLEEAFESLEEAEIKLATTLEDINKSIDAKIVSKVGIFESQINQAQLLLIFLPLVAFGIFLGLFYFLNQSIVSRLKELEFITQRVSNGELNLSAKVDSRDEIGRLAYAFNNMTNQVGDLLGNLEEKVIERTSQLETVVEVSQRLSSILDLSDLMHEVVNLTKETFKFYHVHIYLLDEWGETLMMIEGYGEAGAEMKQQRHSIPLAAPKSLVARAAREGQIITIDNVHQNPHWLPNSLLPETRSEAAVPIYLVNEIVGVLDVQSEEYSGITEEHEKVLQALASQLATAVGNARLFQQTQEALHRAETLQNLYTGDAWQKLTKTRMSNFEINRSSALPPLPESLTPEAEAALQQKQTINLISNGSSHSQNEKDEKQEMNGMSHQLATPLKLRNQVIGILGLQDNNSERQWTSDEIALIEAVSEQMSLALENARLFDETGRRAGRERIITDVTQQVWASGELESIMQAAVEQLGAKLDAFKVVIRLGTQDKLLNDLTIKN